jgi:hydrogenase nickel incorporation protein HypA/HybF
MLRTRATEHCDVPDVIVMHETGIVASFLDAVEDRAAGRQVLGVRLRIGALHRVVEPALERAFEVLSRGTVAEGAAVELVTVPARVLCARCGRRSTVAEPVAACPACGATGPELTGGDELVLEWIRVANAPVR